jgi:hypothetical protein
MGVDSAFECPCGVVDVSVGAESEVGVGCGIGVSFGCGVGERMMLVVVMRGWRC